MASGQGPQDKGSTKPIDPTEAATERRPAPAPNIEAQQVAMGSAATGIEGLRAASAAEAAAAGADTAPIPLPTGIDSLTNKATGNIRKPRPGGCSYLMFDIHDMRHQAENGTLKLLMADIKLVSNTADYHVSIENGFLTVLGTSERATNSLLALATSIKTIDPSSKLFIGNAEITYPEKEMVVMNLPMGETRTAWSAKPAGMRITEEMYQLYLNKSKSREGSHFEIEVSEPDELNLREILSYKAKVGKDIGGPDEMVGYENEGTDLNFRLRDDDTKLIILKGAAGIGKSRLLNEQLAKLPSYILCSLDAADKNVPGASLITLAAQLAQIIEEDPILRSDEGEGASAKVVSFSRLPLSEKRKLAERNPAQLADMCTSALGIINFAKGQKTPLIIEDLHHADRHSEKYLLEIAKRYLDSTDSTAKVVFSMRPEEMYESDAQRNLEKSIGEFYGEDSTHEVSLTGLDFSDPKVSEKYCFHSLPVAVRQGKTLGPWHTELGKRAGRSPLIMTTLMATLLENPSNFTVDDGVINVKPQALAMFDHIEPDDPSGLAGVYHQRIAALDEGSRAVLQAVALAGGRISSAQISAVIKKFAGESIDTFAAVTTKLVEGGYVKETDGSIALQHEMIGPFVIGSITDPERKTMMANLLYGIVGSDPETPNSSKFAMLHHIAGAKDAPGPDEKFWEEYAKVVEACLDDAKDHNAYGSAYATAKAVLDRETGALAVKMAIQALTALITNSPTHIENLASKVLLSLAQSALYLGRFDEMQEAIEKLKEMVAVRRRGPGGIQEVQRLNSMEGKITLIEFEAAYVKAAQDPKEREKLAKIYTAQIQSSSAIPVAQKAAAGIKYFIRRHDIASAQKIYDEHFDTLQRESDAHAKTHDGMPSPELAEIQRLLQIIGPINILRKRILNIDANTVLDDDCAYCPEALTAEQKTESAAIKDAHDKVKALKEKFPGLYNPYSELGIMNAEFMIASYEGDYETAFKATREAMRIADQMDLGNEFGRHVNDLAMLNFTTGKPKEAFKVLTREGKLVKSRLEKENVFQFYMRAQAVIAAAMICRNQSEQTPKAEMATYVQEALVLFTEINQQFPKYAKDPEAAYGLMGYISPILAKAKELGIPLPENIDNPEVYPFMKPEVVASGITHATKVSDKGIRGVAGEKRHGLYELCEGLLKRRDSKLKD